MKFNLNTYIINNNVSFFEEHCQELILYSMYAGAINLSSSLASPNDETLGQICTSCASTQPPSRKAISTNMYQLNIMPCFSTRLDIENTTYIFEVVLSLINSHFSVEFKVSLSPDQENHGFLVCILSGLTYPALQIVETFLVVNGKGEKDPTDALIERPHDGPESFLTSLNKELLTVSQICNLTCNLSSILMVLDVN